MERLAVFALLLQRNPHQFREQRLGEAAYLWMLLGGDGQGALIPLDAVIAIRAFKFRHPSQLIEHVDGNLQPLPQIIRWVTPSGSDVTARLPQDRFQLLWWQRAGKHRQQLLQHRPIRFRIELFGGGSEIVDIGGFAVSAPRASLLHKAIALKRVEMSAHGVVGEAKRLSQLIHRAAGTTQQGDDAPPRAGKKTLIPVCGHSITSCKFEGSIINNTLQCQESQVNY